MSNHDNPAASLPNNLDEAKGRAKQAAGDLTGNEELSKEGKADEIAGAIKDKVDDAVDAVKDKIDDVRGRIDR